MRLRSCRESIVLFRCALRDRYFETWVSFPFFSLSKSYLSGRELRRAGCLRKTTSVLRPANSYGMQAQRQPNLMGHLMHIAAAVFHNADLIAVIDGLDSGESNASRIPGCC
jgi:hypothetical protein